MTDATDPAHAGSDEGATVTLSAEQANVHTEWVVAGRVRLRTRIVTETRTIEVVVRREELVVDTADVVGLGPDGRTWAGSNFGGPAVAPPTAPPAVSITLREEYPEVRVSTRPYEQVTLSGRLVTHAVPVTSAMRREVLDVDVAPTTTNEGA